MMEAIRNGVADMAGKGSTAWFDGARDGVKALRMSGWMVQRFLETTVAPTLDGTLGMQQWMAGRALSAVRGEVAPAEVIREAGNRFTAGWRFGQLMQTVGKEIFGSATFPGEVVLAEDGAYRLSYLPPKKRLKKAVPAVFHVGGGIPYGDRLFRLLPEANFFDRLLERGLPVYVMELRGDHTVADPRHTTMESLVATLEKFTAAAFDHQGGEKMILEGYCGHGMQAWAWVCSHPAEADARFRGVVNWVAPIDGRECSSVGELSNLAPSFLTDAALDGYGRLYGAFPGFAMQTSLDLSLKNLFPKTPFGRFVAGWNQPAYAAVRGIDDLTPEQRKELAGAYWISPENAERFPLAVDLVRYATALFTKGIGPKGDIPWSIGGKPLSFKTVADRTSLKVLGIYGGKDLVVPDKTAYVLHGVFGDRYRHVVHPTAGHVSYVFMPAQWQPTHPARFDPDPVDLLLSL